MTDGLLTVKNNILSIKDELRDLAKDFSTVKKAAQKFNEQQEEINKLKDSYVSLSSEIQAMNQNTVALFAGYNTSIDALNDTLSQQADIQRIIGEQRQETQKDINELTTKIDGLAGSYQNMTQMTDEIEAAQRRMKDSIKDTNTQLASSMQSLERVVQQAARTANQSDAAEMLRAQRERREEFEKLEKSYGKFVKSEDTTLETLDTRTRIMSATIQEYYDRTQQRKLPFFEGLNLYLEQGGTSAEYLAQFLTSTREELKIFGVEVASVRKFMYGFLPPGTFRLVNKFASSLNFVGGTMRTLKADAENTGNIITKTLFASTLDRKGLRKLTKKREEMESSLTEMQQKREDARQISLSGTSTAEEVADAEKTMSFLDKAIQGQKEQMEKVDKTLKGGMFSIGKMLTPKILLDGLNPVYEKMDFVREELSEAFDDLIEHSGPIGKFVLRGIKALAILTKFLLTATMYFILFALAFNVIKKFVENNSERFKQFFDTIKPIVQGFITKIMEGGKMVLDGVMLFLSGIFGGDGAKIYDGLVGIVSGFGKVLLNGVLALGLSLLALLLSPIYVLWERFKDWGNDQTISIGQKLKDITRLITTILLVMGIIALLPIQLPLIIVAAVGAVVFKALKQLPFFAEGGVSSGGLAVVGEKGPELVNLRAGTRIHSNRDSKKMVSGG
ncbi:MAG TPA: hypothetical protein DHV30_14105, partial [Balneola sp.]|nr:hypothetical protein [Balneola sp.]